MQGVNSTSGKLDKLEESLNSIHISSGSNVIIEENTAPNSIEGGGQTIPKGEDDYSLGKSQPLTGGDHDDMDEDWEFIQKGEIDSVA